MTDQEPASATGQRTDRVGRATAIMAVGTVLSRVTGFLRAAVIAATLGLALTADMFAVADAIPAAMYTIVAGGLLQAVLVPQLVRAMQRDADGGEAYAQRLATAVLLVLAGATALLVLAAPWVIRLYVGAEYAEPRLQAQLDTIVLLSRFTLLQVFFYGVYTLIGQMLNARGRFGPMMFAPILNNVIAIAVFGGFLALMGPLDANAGEFTTAEAAWFGLGSTLGIAAQALVLLPVLSRTGLRLRLRRDLRGVGLGKAFRLGTWVVGLIVVMQVTQIVVIRLATSATAVAAASADVERGAGIAVYNNSFLIVMVPHSVLTVSLATAMLPGLSRYAAQGRLDLVRGGYLEATRMAAGLIIPIAALLGALAGPVALLLFDYGAATGGTDLVALTVAAFAPGLLGFTVTYLSQRAFNAQENTRTPFVVQVVVSATQVALAVSIVPNVRPEFVSAALAGCWSIALLVGAVTAFWMLRHSLGPLDGMRLVGYLSATAIAAAPGSVAVLALVRATPSIWTTSIVGTLGVLLVGALLAALVFALLAFVLRLDPAVYGVDLLRRRLASRR